MLTVACSSCRSDWDQAARQMANSTRYRWSAQHKGNLTINLPGPFGGLLVQSKG